MMPCIVRGENARAISPSPVTLHTHRSLTSRVPFLLQRSSGELASYQQKMFRIDDHVGIAIAGLTSDARVLRSVPKPDFLLPLPP